MVKTISEKLNKLKDQIDKGLPRLSIVSDVLIFIFFSVVMSIVIWSLNKGLLFHDEAFYLLHLKDLEIYSTSYWYLIARSFYPQDIVLIRWITIIILITSHVVFITGVVTYFKHHLNLNIKHFFTLLALSLMGQFVLWMPVQFVPSYWIFNYTAILSSLGFLFISLKQKNEFYAYLFAFITGFFIGIIPFVMITNIPFILLILIIAFLHLKASGNKVIVIYSFSFLTGILLTFILYFSIIQTPQAFILNFQEALKHLNYDHTHGLIPMIKWIIKSIQYLSNEILITAIVIIVSDLFINSRTNLTFKAGIYVVLIAAISFLIIDGFLLSYDTGIFSPSIFLVLFFAILYKNFHLKMFDNKILWIFLTLVLMPFIASLGTNVHFVLRGVAYISVIFVSIYILSYFLNDVKYKLIFTIFLLIVTINFIRLPFTPGWTYQVLSEQTENVKNLGIDQNILLDAPRYENLKKIKATIPSDKYTIVSHRSFWGYVYLLDLKIPYLYFDFSEDLFIDYLKKNPADINNFVFIELNTIPYSPDFFKKLQPFGYDANNFEKIEIDSHVCIYKHINEI